jgi:hypothetical protein
VVHVYVVLLEREGISLALFTTLTVAIGIPPVV